MLACVDLVKKIEDPLILHPLFNSLSSKMMFQWTFSKNRKITVKITILIITRSLQIPFFVLHVTLWSDDRTEERNIISNPPKCTRVLMGSLVSSPSLLKNAKNEPGLYFAFPDLSIRTEGRYTLRFSLMKLAKYVLLRIIIIIIITLYVVRISKRMQKVRL